MLFESAQLYISQGEGFTTLRTFSQTYPFLLLPNCRSTPPVGRQTWIRNLASLGKASLKMRRLQMDDINNASLRHEIMLTQISHLATLRMRLFTHKPLSIPHQRGQRIVPHIALVYIAVLYNLGKTSIVCTNFV